MTPDTLSLRQVHPAFVHNNFVSYQAFSVTSQVFKPTPKDEGKLSVYNGKKFTSESSYYHFISNPVCKSAGVIAVSVQECSNENLSAYENNDPFDGHAVIDYADFNTNQIEKKARRLRNMAMHRGWLFKL